MSHFTFILTPSENRNYNINDFNQYINDMSWYVINSYKNIESAFVTVMKFFGIIPNEFGFLKFKNFRVYEANPGQYMVENRADEELQKLPKFNELEILEIPNNLISSAKKAFENKFDKHNLINKFQNEIYNMIGEIIASYEKQHGEFGKQKNLETDKTLSHQELPKTREEDPHSDPVTKLIGGRFDMRLIDPYYGNMSCGLRLIWNEKLLKDKTPDNPHNFISFCYFLDRNYEELYRFIKQTFVNFLQEQKEEFIKSLNVYVSKKSEYMPTGGYADSVVSYGQGRLDFQDLDDLYENKKRSLNENNTTIKYKTSELNFFLESYKGIKQLRVPSWYLQALYSHKYGDDAMAVVAFDGWKPVAIGTLSRTGDDIEGEYAGLANLYVQPEYRGKGIASQIFRKLERLSTGYEYIEAGRRTAEMFKSRGYKEIDYEPMEIDGGFTFINKNHK